MKEFLFCFNQKMTLIGKVDKEVIVVAFAEAVNLNMECDKYILKKNFKTMELINSTPCFRSATPNTSEW